MVVPFPAVPSTIGWLSKRAKRTYGSSQSFPLLSLVTTFGIKDGAARLNQGGPGPRSSLLLLSSAIVNIVIPNSCRAFRQGSDRRDSPSWASQGRLLLGCGSLPGDPQGIRGCPRSTLSLP